MAKEQTIWVKWIRPILIGSVSSGIIVVAGWSIPYSWGQKSMASVLRDGVAILDAQETLDSLGRNEEDWESVNTLLAERTPRRAERIIADLRQAFADLTDRIDKVETTESYTTAEIRALAKTMSSRSGKDAFIKSHVGKTKRIVKGLSRLKPQVAKIDEMLESLDRQLAQEPSIDLAALRKVMAEIQSSERAAIASLKSKQKTALETLRRFDIDQKPKNEKGDAEASPSKETD